MSGADTNNVERPGNARSSHVANESEARFRAVWQASADAMALSDAQGTVLDVNDAYLQLYGFAYEEVVGQNFAVIFSEDFREEANRQYQEAFNILEVPPVYERVIHRKDGTPRVVESVIDFIEESGTRVAMLSCIRDVTERIRYEEAIRESEERFRQTFDNAPIGMALMGLDFKPFRVNQALCHLLGYTEAELTNLTVADITYPEDLAADLEMAGHLLRGEIPSYKIEKRYLTKSGEILWAQLSVAVIRDRAGHILYGLAMLEDITKRKQGEEERVQILAREQEARVLAERAVRAQEDLLSVVSHDLRNPISVVKGVTQLMERRMKKGQLPNAAQLQQIMGQLNTAVDRMEGFIRDLSTPQNMQPGQLLSITPEPVDLAALARRVADSHQQRTERHQLRVEATTTELVGYWDPARLEQVLDNLLSNAIKYSPEGGVVLIGIGYEECEDVEGNEMGDRLPNGAPGGEPPSLSPDRRAVMTVRDEGMGIPAGDIPYVFEWYRRAANVRDVIGGSGIGLAGARQIIEQHGGSIKIESKEGVGSTFTVLLPLSYASVPGNTEAASDGGPQEA
jgi:PAS domain S-box-containing protein